MGSVHRTATPETPPTGDRPRAVVAQKKTGRGSLPGPFKLQAAAPESDCRTRIT